MANECEFTMRIQSDNENNLKEFVATLIDYDKPQHMWRTQINKIVPHKYCKDIVSELYEYEVLGECAWSVYSCMMTGEHTYADKDPEESIALNELCKQLHTKCELWSYEPGVGFAEHYYFDADGTTLKEDVLDAHDYPLDLEEGDDLDVYGGEWGKMINGLTQDDPDFMAMDIDKDLRNAGFKAVDYSLIWGRELWLDPEEIAKERRQINASKSSQERA